MRAAESTAQVSEIVAKVLNEYAENRSRPPLMLLIDGIDVCPFLGFLKILGIIDFVSGFRKMIVALLLTGGYPSLGKETFVVSSAQVCFE